MRKLVAVFILLALTSPTYAVLPVLVETVPIGGQEVNQLQKMQQQLNAIEKQYKNVESSKKQERKSHA